jgi:hypothetical protein
MDGGSTLILKKVFITTNFEESLEKHGNFEETFFLKKKEYTWFVIQLSVFFVFS